MNCISIFISIRPGSIGLQGVQGGTADGFAFRSIPFFRFRNGLVRDVTQQDVRM